jgi:ribosomal protein S18 acetylase RimI-like enzyme
MKIERLSPEHWQRFRRIRLASLRESPDAFGSTLAEAEALTEPVWRQHLEELPTFLAVHDDADVGIARGAIDDTDASRAFLLSMWVDPAHRRKGIGSKLIQAVADWARSQRLAYLMLDVADNNQRAVELYAAMGFEPTGEVGTLPPPRSFIKEHRRALKL